MISLNCPTYLVKGQSLIDKDMYNTVDKQHVLFKGLHFLLCLSNIQAKFLLSVPEVYHIKGIYTKHTTLTKLQCDLQIFYFF